MKNQAEDERSKSIPLEVPILILSGEDEETADVGTKNPNDVDNKPRDEVVWLSVNYSRYAKDVTEEKDTETKTLTGSSKYMMPLRNSWIFFLIRHLLILSTIAMYIK